MDWLEGEPKLDEVLSEPIVLATMRRDGVDHASLRSLLQAVGRSRSAVSTVLRVEQRAHDDVTRKPVVTGIPLVAPA